MRIRQYIESRDFAYLLKWVDSEKIHALWCANLIPYPITREDFHGLLEKNAQEWSDSAFVATEDNGEVTGFFCYSINVNDNTGFLKLIIVDSAKRGTGCGTEMLRMALQYAFEITGVQAVRLNVFDENGKARRCYEKIGFVEENSLREKFPYKDEVWNRCHLIMRKQIQIIPAKITDTIVLKLFSEHDDYMISFLGDDKGYYTRYSENENIGNVWVAYCDNLPIGCIAYRKKVDGIGEVKRLFIRDEYRGKGISKELLKTVECYAGEQDCHTLFLDTRITLEPAVSIYRSFGFNVIFQQGLYIQMEKKI